MKHIYVLSALILLAGVTASAQSQQTTFFLDNNVYSYRTSPSLSGERNLIGIGVGNLNASLQSDLGVTNFIFPTADGLVTGLNPAVGDEFLNGLRKVNSVAFDINENLLAVGFWAKRGFNSIELNLRGGAFASLPYDMFAFLKQGSPRTYDLSALHASGNVYAELALGHSQAINDKFTVGARLKILAGLTNANMNFNKAEFTIGDTDISAAVDGDIRIASSLLDIPVKASEISSATDVIDLENYAVIDDFREFRPSGYGAALDLGVTYKPVKNLEITASILDFGAIIWTYNCLCNSNAGASIQGLREDVYIKDTFTAIEDDINAALDEFKGLTEFHKSLSDTKSFESLNWTANIGARYRIPHVERISAGALFTYKGGKYTSWYDLRGGLTLTPFNFLSLTGNYGISSFGPVCGAALSLNVLNFDLMLGIDGYSGSCARIPLEDTVELGPVSVSNLLAPLGKFKYNGKIGITLTFGERHNAYSGKKKKKKAEDELVPQEQVHIDYPEDLGPEEIAQP